MAEAEWRAQMAGILTGEERATLTAALNRIVPAREELPGAGDLGVAATIEQGLTESPTLRRAFLDGLRAIELCGGARGFAALDADAQDSCLLRVEAREPAFFATLVEYAYRGYYVLPEVQRAIGLSGEPPQPRGYQLAPFDPALLVVQRRRQPFWRRTDGEGQ
jgi:hypothetical protein